MTEMMFAITTLTIVLVYLLPALVAAHRKHRDANAIFIINLFFGWTFLGWVLSLAWSLTGNIERSLEASKA